MFHFAPRIHLFQFIFLLRNVLAKIRFREDVLEGQTCVRDKEKISLKFESSFTFQILLDNDTFIDHSLESQMEHFFFFMLLIR